MMILEETQAKSMDGLATFRCDISHLSAIASPKADCLSLSMNFGGLPGQSSEWTPREIERHATQYRLMTEVLRTITRLHWMSQ